MTLQRRDGWESRLSAVLDGARNRPYVLGEWDCLRLACAAVEALTGTDLWPRFAGYHTRRGALVVIARIAPTLGEAVTATLGVSPTPTFSAWRGDIVLYRDVAGENHLGVVAGARAVLMLDTGAVHLPLTDAGLLCAWRVG
jgi:hypothetical protein